MSEKIRAKDAMARLGASHSTFYRLLKKHRKEIWEGISTDDAGLYLTLAGLAHFADLAGIPLKPDGTQNPTASPIESQVGLNGTHVGLDGTGNETRMGLSGTQPSPTESQPPGDGPVVAVLREAVTILREQLSEKDKVIAGLIDNSAEERKRSDHLLAMMGRELSEYRRLFEDTKKSADRLLTISAVPTGRKVASSVSPSGKESSKQAVRAIAQPVSETIGERLAREVLEFFQPWRRREEFRYTRFAPIGVGTARN